MSIKKMFIITLLYLVTSVAFAVEQTSTGFYWPIGTSNFDSSGGTWLGRDAAHESAADAPHYFDGLYHIGVDMGASIGAPAYAVSNGEVFLVHTSDSDWGPGNSAVFIRHTTNKGVIFTGLYGHIRPSVGTGDTVYAGQVIGTIGPYSGGSHLHFGVRFGDSSGNSPWGRLPNSSWNSTNGFIDPVDFITNSSYAPGPSKVMCASIGGGRRACWLTKSALDLTCSHAQAWAIDDSNIGQTQMADSSICSTTITQCIVGSAKGFNFLDWFISTADAASVDSCAVVDTSQSYFMTGERSSSETTNPYPVTGGTNSGTRPNLIPNNSDIENASKVKVLTLHINEPGFCKMQTKNIGNADAGAFQSKCFISDGYKIDNNPRDEGKEDTQSLAKGDTHTEHEDFVAPEFPGTYNAVWCTDSAKQIMELNEGDNCHTEDVFTVWSNPNVLATNISIIGGKTVLLPGESYSVDTTILNNGENFGKDIRVGWYLTGPSTNGSRVLLDTDNIKRENLKGGVSKVENLSARPAPQIAGNYLLESCPDYDNRIAETNESDNCKSLNFEIQPLSNFVATSIDIAGTVTSGIAFNPSVDIVNNGGIASQIIKVGYYLDNVLVGTDQIQPQDLPLNGTRNEILENLTVSTVGSHTFKSCIDYLGEIAESNEGDNCGEKAFTVQNPPSPLSSPPPPSPMTQEDDDAMFLQLLLD